MLRFFRKKEVTAPADEYKLVREGEAAKLFLASDAYKDVMESLEEQMWMQFMDTPADSPEARDTLYLHISALRHIQTELQTRVDRGRLAKHHIDIMEKQNGNT